MNRPPTACSNPNGCANQAELGSNYCAQCRSIKMTVVSKHDYHREWRAMYNTKRWRDLREDVLRRANYICQVCKRAPATVADHIVDHRGNPILFYDSNNIQASCSPCHDEKTGSQHGTGSRMAPAPHSVNGIMKDHGPTIQVQVKHADPNFNFLAAMKKKIDPSGSSGTPSVCS